jgi:hypothetical protein
MAAKCDITRNEFRAGARAVGVKVGAKDLLAVAKEFSTGSLGWNVNDKVLMEVGGRQVMCQVGLNITVIGSKELPGAA